MTEQPEALRLADALDRGENFYAESSIWFDGRLAEAAGEAATELRRLHEKVQLLKGAVEAEQNYIATMRDLANANGKLNALNQELLEALKAADWYIGQLEPFVYGADDDGVHEEHAKVRAAIAKAEGETK